VWIGEHDCEWALVTGPTIEPISLDEAKLQSAITQDDDNALIASYIRSAREAGQNFLNRAFYTQTWKLQLAGFDDVIWLPMAAPLQSVTSVQYYDTDGNLQTLATSYYDVDTTSEPGRVVRKPNQTYPSVESDRLRPVLITYVCGWSSVDTIPEAIKQGLRVYVSAMEGDRSGTIAEASVRAAQALWTQAGHVWWRPPECLYR
jgi:uncharacterized phiE125 gp8 family phage protein